MLGNATEPVLLFRECDAFWPSRTNNLSYADVGFSLALVHRMTSLGSDCAATGALPLSALRCSFTFDRVEPRRTGSVAERFLQASNVTTLLRDRLLVTVGTLVVCDREPLHAMFHAVLWMSVRDPDRCLYAVILTATKSEVGTLLRRSAALPTDRAMYPS